MTPFDPAEIFTRSDVVVADVDTRLRLIDLVAVPWDEEAEVIWRDEFWHEVFRRGAFDGLEDHIGRVRVNREHVIGDTVGRLVWADPYAEAGLITRAKISETDRGNDTLGLADDDAISGSVGFRIDDPADVTLHRRTKMREVLKAFLSHLSLVESPAYVGAKVLAVREQDDPESLNPPEYAATLNEAWADPEYLRALERLNRSRAGIDQT